MITLFYFGNSRSNSNAKNDYGSVSNQSGVVDPESNIDGDIMDLDNEPCDVMLVLVDPAKHMDKFFILQLIERTPTQGSCSGSYVVYTRWGRTGTAGQALEQDFDEYHEALDGFENNSP